MNKILIMAIGGAGCNMALAHKNSLQNSQTNVDYQFADTDDEALISLNQKGFNTVKLTGGHIPTSIFCGVEKLIILAGLGGKTGSKYLPAAADSAHAAGISRPSIVVTTPFSFEGSEKAATAAATLKSLSDQTLKILPNDTLLHLFPDRPISEALTPSISDLFLHL